MYLIYIAEGDSKTSHYALATGFMALGMMGMLMDTFKNILDMVISLFGCCSHNSRVNFIDFYFSQRLW
jgi:hypothetical protein